jgi:AcrR family transcriptional regulator
MPRDTLTRGQVITAAIELMDAEGLDGLNMRALGRRLGSAATAVYWHVGSKANLIALAGDQAWGEVTLPDPIAVGWRAAATTMAAGLHAMLTRHAWVVQAFGSYPLFGPGKARHDDHLLAIYEAAGFPAAKADQATAAVCTYVLGNALGPAVATQFPRLRARLETPTADYYASPEHSFEFGLEAILDGLEAQLIGAGLTVEKPPQHSERAR